MLERTQKVSMTSLKEAGAVSGTGVKAKYVVLVLSGLVSW